MTEGSKIKVPQFVSFTNTWHTEPYDAISPFRTELSVKGKTVVVTGGGTGIGRSIAKAFVQAGAASVAILGRREDRLKAAIDEFASIARAEPCLLLCEVCDLTDRVQTNKAFESITAAQGRKIDILVSNAGASPSASPVIEFEEEEFMHLIDVNVRSTLNAVHAFVPRAAKDAILLHISSGVVHIDPIPGISSHAASKAASAKLIEYVQAENPELHVVSVQPGAIQTEASAKIGTKGKDDVNLPGQFCVWLASAEARFLKSKYVWANWDVDELKLRADEISSTRLLNIKLQGVLM